jgi:O-antigen/teichoic acid export membrane protein
VSGDPRPPPRKGVRDFVADNLIVAVAQLLAKLRSLVMLPLIVRGLGTAGYGVWAQVLAFVGFVGAIVSWNLHHPLVQSIAADRKSAARTYATLTLATVVFAALGTIAVAPFTGFTSRLMLGDANIERYLLLALLLALFNNVRQMNLSVYRALGRFTARGVVDLGGAVIELGAIAAVLGLGHGLSAVLAVMVACGGLVAIVGSLHAGTLTGWARPAWPVLREALRYSTPLMPGVLSLWILDRGDRFVVGHYLGAVGVARYSAAYAVGFLLLHALAPLQMTLLPRVAELWDRDRALAARYIVTSNRAFVALAIPYVAATYFVAPALLVELANDEIASQSASTSTLVAVGIAFYGIGNMQAQAFYAARRTSVIGFIWALAALLNVGLNFLLVPRLGVAGAALATAVSYAATCAAFARALRGLIDFDYQPLHVLKAAAATVPMALTLWLLAPRGVAALVGSCALAGVVYFGVFLALKGLSSAEIDMARRALGRLRSRLRPRGAG